MLSGAEEESEGAKDPVLPAGQATTHTKPSRRGRGRGGRGKKKGKQRCRRGRQELALKQRFSCTTDSKEEMGSNEGARGQKYDVRGRLARAASRGYYSKSGQRYGAVNKSRIGFH